MSRPLRLSLVALGVLLFLLASLVLARLLTVGGAERGAIEDLLRARAGRGAEVLRLDPPTRVSLGPTTRTVRVAWRRGRSLERRPFVQCVEVRRTGNVLSGFEVELSDFGPRIDSEGACPD